MADTQTTHTLSRIVDASGDAWDIKAKALESQITISTTGDVTGSATTDLSGAVSIPQTIGDSKVTTSKIADGNVTTAKVADKAITLDKIADSARGGSVSDNDGVLATHAQVKSAIDTAISGQGAYKGKQTVATINTWVAANLNNGDRVICEDSGTITLGSITVRAGEDLIFFKSTDGSTAIWQTMDGEFKLKQSAKESPDPSSTAVAFIDTITQDENGEITATKKTVQDASSSQKGVMKVGTGLSASSGTVSVSYGTAAGTACQGNDSRLSNARTPTSHAHGNIQNGGTLQTTDVTIASGDKLVITDSSDSSKVARASASFDGSTTTTALTPKGTFEAFAKAADITTEIQKLDKTDTAETNQFVTAVSEADGVINVSRAQPEISNVNGLQDALDAKVDDSQIVTSWSTTTSDTNIPSEKLVKTALDGKQAAGNYKTTQTAKSDPTASGTTITAIDTITQNANGEITATKKTIRTATTSQTGVVQLSSTTSTTEEGKAATPKGVANAIAALDVTDSAVTNQFVTQVSETDGKIAVSRAQPTIANVSGLQTALDGKEPVFTINYDATNNALVFSKTFGTVS